MGFSITDYFKDRLKDYFFWGAVIASLFTLISRLIYINLNKGLWWDAASFLVLLQGIVSKANCVWEAHRLPGFPLLLAPFYAVFGMNLIIFNVIEILFAAGAVFMVYLLGAKLFNKKVGIIASIFLALSWLNFFYGLRVLSRIPGAFFILVGLYCFWEGWTNKKWKHMAVAGLALGFYYLIRTDAVFIFGALALFLLVELVITKEKLKFVTDKKLWIFAGCALISIVPYMIWQFFKFGSPIYQSVLNYELVKANAQSFLVQFAFMPHIMGNWLWLALLGIGTLICLIKIKNPRFRYILLIFALFFIGIAQTPYHEDRFILPILPVIGIICGIGLTGIVNAVIKNEKISIAILIGIAILLGVWSMSYGWPIIQAKGPSYGSVQQMGMELNTMYNDVVYVPYSIGAPDPQLCVWSKKNYKEYPNTSEEFFNNFKEGELAYCSIGYESCPTYLLPQVTSEEAFNSVLGELQNKSIKLAKVTQDSMAASLIFEKVGQNSTE